MVGLHLRGAIGGKAARCAEPVAGQRHGVDEYGVNGVGIGVHHDAHGTGAIGVLDDVRTCLRGHPGKSGSDDLGQNRDIAVNGHLDFETRGPDFRHLLLDRLQRRFIHDRETHSRIELRGRFETVGSPQELEHMPQIRRGRAARARDELQVLRQPRVNVAAQPGRLGAHDHHRRRVDGGIVELSGDRSALGRQFRPPLFLEIDVGQSLAQQKLAKKYKDHLEGEPHESSPDQFPLIRRAR